MVKKTRGSETMTESQFWSKIRSALRQSSRWWKPIETCKKNAKRVYKGINKRQKFEYLCNSCKAYFPEKEISIDHIIPAGSLNKAEDLQYFVERLFVEINGLQTLCNECHNVKTLQDKINIKNSKL